MIVTCQQCGKTGDIPKEYIGKLVTCSCGKNFIIAEQKCPFCGEFIKAEAMKCRFCQSMLDGSDPQKEAMESQIHAHRDTIYRILCLFFGMLGIHDIYAGYGGQGALKLFLTVVGLMTLDSLGWIPLLAVAIYCIIDLSRGIPKKKPAPVTRKVMVFRAVILLILLAGLVVFLSRYIVPLR